MTFSGSNFPGRPDSIAGEGAGFLGGAAGIIRLESVMDDDNGGVAAPGAEARIGRLCTDAAGI
jgi:hypothetical protein